MKTYLFVASTCLAGLLLVKPAQAQTAKKTTTPGTVTAKKTTTSTVKKSPSTKSTTAAKSTTTSTANSNKTVVKDTAVVAKTKVVEEAPISIQPEPVTKPVATAPVTTPVTATKSTVNAFQNPFKKGTLSLINKTNVDYDYYKTEMNNKTSDLLFGADINYFFIDNFAIGVDLRYRSTSTKPAAASTYSYYMGYLNLTYGRNITPRLSLYARLTGGIGHSKSFYTQTLEADYKNISGTIGAPIAITTEGSIFMTPYISYDYNKTKAANHDITERGFNFGIRMESYLNNSAVKKTNQPISPWPKKGVSFIEYSTSAGYSFSKRKEYQGNIRFGDVKKNSTNIGLGYHYYFLDFLAGGLDISYTRNYSNNGSPDFIRSFLIRPTITANAPVASGLKYLFLQVSYGKSWSNENNTKEDASNLSLRLGYNLFIAKNISFSPKLGYELYNSTHHTSGGDHKYRENGFAAEIGIRAWINTHWFSK